ncbi:MAG: PqiC family protein [Thermodesulfobacteriota bacterium]
MPRPPSLHKPLARLATAAVCAALAVLLGCSALLAPRTEPMQLFVLGAAPADGAGSSGSAGGGSTSIGLGPVTLPGYLDRREIVTRVAPNQLRLSQNEQWAEPLLENVRSVLAQDLAARLGGATVATFPWAGGFRPDYRVRVDVTRFEPTSAGTAELAARWQVLAGSDVVAARDSSISRPIGDGGTAAAVAALGQALGDLASEIAAAIPPAPRPTERRRP